MTDYEIANNWVQYQRNCIVHGRDSSIAEESFGGYEAFDSICWKEPVRGLKIVRDIFEMRPEERIFYNLAAGPLEDLLVRHGNEVMPHLKQHLQENPAFFELLEGVWVGRMTEEVQRQLDEICSEFSGRSSDAS